MISEAPDSSTLCMYKLISEASSSSIFSLFIGFCTFVTKTTSNSTLGTGESRCLTREIVASSQEYRCLSFHFLLILKPQSLSTGFKEDPRTSGGAGLPFSSRKLLRFYLSCQSVWQEKLGTSQKQGHGLWEGTPDFPAEICFLVMLLQNVGW